MGKVKKQTKMVECYLTSDSRYFLSKTEANAHQNELDAFQKTAEWIAKAEQEYEVAEYPFLKSEGCKAIVGVFPHIGAFEEYCLAKIGSKPFVGFEVSKDEPIILTQESQFQGDRWSCQLISELLDDLKPYHDDYKLIRSYYLEQKK